MQVRRALNLDADAVATLVAPYTPATTAWRRDWLEWWPTLLVMPHALVIVACAEASAAPVAVGIVVMTPALTGATRCDATIYPLIGVPAYRRQVKERLRASARMMGARSLYLDGETLPVTEAHGLAGGDQRRRA